jgi:ACS family glucarate transporter-like MFS transporter
VSSEELAYIQAERVNPVSEHVGWGLVLRAPRVWTLVIAYTFWVYNMWLMASWLPTYLVKGRGFSVSEMGWFGFLITGMALIGTVGSGWLSDTLLRKGFSTTTARKTLSLVGMVVGAPLLALAVSVESGWMCVVLLMGSRLLNDSSLAGFMSLPTEMSPRHIGAIWGCMSTFGSLAGVAATTFAGYQVTATGNWALPFYTSAALILVAAVVMAVGVSPRPLFLEQSEEKRAIQPELMGERVRL